MRIFLTVFLIIIFISSLDSHEERDTTKKTIILKTEITIINKNDKKYAKNSTSPYVAGVLSIMPVWSGSWNKGFDGWGLFFVISKLGSLSAMTYFATQTETIEYDYQDENYEPSDQEFNSRFYYSLGALCSFILIDISYWSLAILIIKDVC